ncbi:MAG: hypothetical protein J6X43_10435 [Bacteroidales bacterium]|nr:hypothetical protein [Bacteroidales bacterium]
MKKIIVTIFCCSIACSLFATIDYRNAGLGVPHHSNHGFELPITNAQKSTVIKKNSTIEKSTVQNSKHRTSKRSAKRGQKSFTQQIKKSYTNDFVSKKEIKVLQKKQHSTITKSVQKKTDSSNIIITLIIVTGVLLCVAMLVFGWYWLVFGAWYY